MDTLAIVLFALMFLMGSKILSALGGIRRKVMTLSEAVASVQAGVAEIGSAVGNVQTSVNQVIEDLQNAGDTTAAIEALQNAASQLGTIAANANTAAETLSSADPTPPASE